MRTIEIGIYQFEELSDKAKEKARDWYRRDDDFEPNLEPAETAARILGITYKQVPVRLMNGSTRYDPDIRYEGFYSQGDGASFTGYYSYVKGSPEKIRYEFGGNGDHHLKLHKMADELREIQRKYFYGLTATIDLTGREVHAYSMQIEAYDRNYNLVTKEINDQVTKVLRDFANWIYDGLKADYEYSQSNKSVDEMIIANEYEFTEDGERAKNN